MSEQRDWAADEALCAAAEPGPLTVLSPEAVETTRRLFPERVPEGAVIIERPPQSRAEAMTTFMDIRAVGQMSGEDAALFAAAREGWPAALAERRRLEELAATLKFACGAVEGERYALRLVGEAIADGAALRFTYTNWRGETATRVATPRGLFYGAAEWHPEPQWLVAADDAAKGDRTFALAGMRDIARAEAEGDR